MTAPRRILTIFGTRPEAIKLFPLVHALEGDARFDSRVCVSAQHRGMLDQVLAISGIAPHHDLDLMQPDQTLDSLTANLLTGLGRVMDAERPDWVVVQGDTATAMAGALAAYYRKIPVAHVEAGLRSGNIHHPWPEEVNRKVIGTIAALHCAPTETAAEALRRENVDPRTIHVTGNTVIDALHWITARIEAEPGLASGLAEQAGEVRVVERLDQRDVVEPGELGIHHPAHVGVEMDGEDHRHVGPRREAADRRSDRLHAFAEALAAMAGDADDALAREPLLETGEAAGERGLLGNARGDPVQRVDDGIAGYVDRSGIDVLAPQRFRGGLGRRAMQRGDRADDLAVHFLGPRMMDVAAAQTGLDVRDRDLAVIRGQRPGHRRGGVALDDHPVGPLRVHDAAEPGEQRGGQRVERLVGTHQVEIVVGRDPGDVEDLVEHAAVLRADADSAVEAIVGFERVDQREKLDRFGPGAEDGEDASGHRPPLAESG